VTNLTCPDERSVYLEWTRPEIYYHSVDAYRVFYRRRDTAAVDGDATLGGDVDVGGGPWAVQERHQNIVQ
jgi:hypothetical protein